MKRIKIICDVPLSKEHGLEVGSEWDVIEEAGGGRSGGFWIKTKAGVKAKVFHRECELVAKPISPP